VRRIFALLIAMACLSMAAAAAQRGTFDAVATGVVSARLTGQTSSRVTPGGEVVILLSTSAPSPIAIVITGETGNLPAAETSFTLVSESCDNDAPSAAAVERAGGFLVTVRGGPMTSPDWSASAHAGTLTISRSANAITGRFDVSACGEHLKSGDRVELTLRGTFQVGTSK
jgi:hypothetical protein